MARFAALGLGLAGAALGSFVGMPQLGFLAGSLVGNLLFPPQGPVIEGPRLGDLSVTSSAYGVFRAIGYGTMREGGNIIWGLDIEEHRHKQKQGGKGSMMGGAAATNITYSYYGNFALAFGEGPAEDILRIWADGKLIFDKTGTGSQASKPTLNFRFYRGTETQLPDPLIVADKGAQTPAYRGTVYLVFEDLPLADYGNRIPTLTAEIAYKHTTPQLGGNLAFAAGAGGYQRNGVAVDWYRNEVYVEGSGGTYATGTLTFTGQPGNNSTVTIGSRTYTWKTTLTGVANEVKIAASQALSILNLQYAINDSGGVEGTDYGTGTTEHPDVFSDASLTTGTTLVATAKVIGTGGNSIGTTETDVNTSWGAATLLGGTAGSTKLYTFDTETRVETRRVDVTDGTTLYNTAVLCALGNGQVLVKGPFGGNSTQASRVDPTTGSIVGTFGAGGNGLGNDYNSFASINRAVPIIAAGPYGLVHFAMTASFNGLWGLLKADDMTLTPTQAQAVAATDPCPGFLSKGQDVTGTFTTPVISGGAIGAGFGDGYVGVQVGTPRIIRRVRAYWNAKAAIPVTDSLGNIQDQVESGIETTDLADLNALYGVTATFRAIWHDQTDDSVIVMMTNGDTFKWNTHLATPLVWRVTLPIGSSGPLYETGAFSYLGDGRLGYIVTDTTYLIDTRDGTTISTQTNWSAVNGDGVFGTSFFNSSMNMLVYVGTAGGDLNLAFLDRAQRGTETLATIVTDICLKAGMLSTDIDTSNLDQVVKGFLIGRLATARSSLEVLARAFFFDGIETDWTLKFIKRGTASVITIPENDLIAHSSKSGEVIREARTQELELPEVVTVTYYDVDRDYQQGAQSVKRIRSPHPTMYSENKVNIEFPIVFDAIEAAGIVERALIQAWVERISVSYQLPMRYLKYDPGDVVSIQRNDGTIYKLRQTKVNTGVNLQIEVEGALTDQTTYSATGGIGQSGVLNPQAPPVVQATKMIVLNTPLLRDSDDTGRTGGIEYVVAAGYMADQTAWRGCTTFRSYDGQTYLALIRVVNPMVWGTCANKLNTADPHVTDRTNTLTVYLANPGSGLTTISELAMLTAANGENAAAVGNPVDGWEVIQFATPVLNADGTWTVSTMLRGRRGTEHQVGKHKAGDIFVLLTPETVELFGVPLADANQTSYYKGVGSGQIPEDVEYQVVPNSFNDLKPYSPSHVTAHYADRLAGDLDITIDWKRRTRLGGGWKDGGGEVPLNEDNEKYEIDIYTVDGTQLRRTVTGLTTPQYVYNTTDVQQDNLDPANLSETAQTVTNPGAEAGSMTGWTNNGGTIIASSSSPYVGTWSFAGTNVGSQKYYQDIAVPVGQQAIVDSGQAVAVLRWQSNSGSIGSGRMELAFKDGGGVFTTITSAIIAASSFHGETYPTPTYQNNDPPVVGNQVYQIASPNIAGSHGRMTSTLTVPIPANTRTIRIAMWGSSGGGANYKWDEISLAIATGNPTPAGLNVKIYQISAQVGRGFAFESVLLIEDS